MLLEEWLLGQNKIPLPMIKKTISKEGTGVIASSLWTDLFFAFMQCSFSSNLVVFSENDRDKIREKMICSFNLF